MTRALALVALSLSTLAAGPLAAQEKIGTVQRGVYVCEVPGNAAQEASMTMPEAGFRIRSGSRYESPQGDGFYLRRGDRMMMTSGPHNGDVYRVEQDGLLRRMAGEEPTRLRCIRRSR